MVMVEERHKIYPIAIFLNQNLDIWFDKYEDIYESYRPKNVKSECHRKVVSAIGCF